MRTACSTVVFLMILTMGLSLAVLPQDIPGTAFDESESPPYETTLLFSIGVRPMAATASKRTVNYPCPLRFPRAQGRGQYHIPYGRVSVQPGFGSLAIIDCSLRC